MTILEQMRKEVFEASKSGDAVKAGILQLSIAAIKNEALKADKDLSTEEEIKVLRAEVKKIKDSIAQYSSAGRVDLVEEEEKQLAILEAYLPALLPSDEVEKIVKAKAAELNALSMRDMGRLMGVVMKELAGKADGNEVNAIVKKVLGGEN